MIFQSPDLASRNGKIGLLASGPSSEGVREGHFDTVQAGTDDRVLSFAPRRFVRLAVHTNRRSENTKQEAQRRESSDDLDGSLLPLLCRGVGRMGAWRRLSAYDTPVLCRYAKPSIGRRACRDPPSEHFREEMNFPAQTFDLNQALCLQRTTQLPCSLPNAVSTQWISPPLVPYVRTPLRQSH